MFVIFIITQARGVFSFWFKKTRTRWYKFEKLIKLYVSDAIHILDFNKLITKGEVYAF